MILVVLEKLGKDISKTSLEAISFATRLGGHTGLKTMGIAGGELEDMPGLGAYGLDELAVFNGLDFMDSGQWVSVIEQACKKWNPQYVILSHNSLGKSIAGGLSVRLRKGLIS
ncbi:MAG TPA: hypothetical protein VFX48_07295, partial [Saprospiraceae bacterium]|nr:hypothetical protein [Saprospiraceae bacterium]